MKKTKAKKLLLIVIILVVAASCFVSYGAYKYETGNYKGNVEKDSKPMFNNLEELQLKLNKSFEDKKLNLKLKNKNIEEDSKLDYYKERLQNNLTITAAIDKTDKSIKNAGVIALSDNSQEAITGIKLIFTIVMKDATPKNEEYIDQILDELDYINMKSKPVGTETSAIRNGFKYTLKKNHEEGKMYSLMFVIGKI